MTNGYHPPKTSLKTAIKSAVKRLKKPRRTTAQTKSHRDSS
jgi:hypothetical protein